MHSCMRFSLFAIVKSSLFFFVFFLLAQSASAADLSILSPQTAEKGKTFTVTLQAKTNTQTINAVSGTLSFPKSKVKVTSISKSNSIINFWAQEPVYSNTNGSVSFEGVVLNPGYKGNNGTIIKITFSALATGEVPLVFTSGSILANDGEGTNILSSLGEANITIIDATPIEDEVVSMTPSYAKPLLPVITSLTHPDQEKWYKERDISVAWIVPAGVTTVFAGINQKADTNPVIPAKGLRNSFALRNARDGIWYTHVKFANQSGISETAHFIARIDGTPPDTFVVTPFDNDDTSRAYFSLNATDSTSGVAGYEIAYSDSVYAPLSVSSGIGQTKVLPKGEHLTKIKVFDYAGNSLEKEIRFSTDGLMKPVVTSYPKETITTTSFSILGRANPLVEIILELASEKDGYREIKSKTNEDGSFTLEVDTLRKGETYTFTAYTTADNVKSEKTIPFSVRVGLPFMDSVYLAISQYWLYGVIITALIVLIGLVRMLLRRKRRAPGVYPVGGSMVVHHALGAELAILEKMKRGEPFSLEERHYLSQLRRDLGFIDQAQGVGEQKQREKVLDINTIGRKIGK